MRIDTKLQCKAQPECDDYSPIAAQVTKSLVVDRTNTLHQFDTTDIIGLPSPVGKVPIVFYIRESEQGGRRGIIFGEDYDSVCFMYPEQEHEDWCSQPYDIKYDKIEEYDDGEEKGHYRNFGILDLWVSVCRKWYNGEVMYRPKLKIQGCGRRTGGYPAAASTAEVITEQKQNKVVAAKKTNINHSCGCRKES